MRPTSHSTPPVVLLLFWGAHRLGAARIPAFVAALLFTVHPLSVQSVCWIAGRNDVLLGLFALLSVLGLDASLRGDRPWGPWLHAAAFGLALFTKETAVVLLPVYGLLAWLWYGRPSVHRDRPRLVAVDVVIVGVWAVARQLALGGGDGATAGSQPLTTAVTNLPQVLVYLGKVIFPLNLSVMPSVGATGLALGVVSLAVLTAALHPLPTRRQVAVFAWFVLFLAPPLIVPGLPAYEHRTYVPLIGLALGVSQLPALDGAGWRWPRQAALAVVVVFAVLTFRHQAQFRDALTYWASATVGTAYAPIAHVNVGRMLEEVGDLGRAATAYRAALAIDPATPKANNNLGVVMMAQGREALALPYFEREVEVNPANAEAHFNIGLFHKVSGRPADGVTHWEATIALNAYFRPAYEQLIEYYREAGDAGRAEEYEERLSALGRR